MTHSSVTITHHKAEMQTMLDAIISLAKSQLSKEKVNLFAKFVYLYYSNLSIEDMLLKTPLELFTIAYSHWELMLIRKPKEIQLRILNPILEQNDFTSNHTIIEVVTDDMPFLVDSIRMEINRLGFTIYLMICCGGVKVTRNKKYELEDIESYQGGYNEGNSVEAPIYLEIDRQADPKILADIKQNLLRVLHDVYMAVEDWQDMRKHMQKAIVELKTKKIPLDPAEIEESCAFLEWLMNDHFTFLGYRNYEVIGSDEAAALHLISGSGLGVLRDHAHSKVLRQYADLPKAARDIALSRKEILIISKTNTVSTVHRPAYTDFIGIKRFDENGKLQGEYRFIGLYTSGAYSSNPKYIPVLRRKVATILEKSGLRLSSHVGKDLMHILATFPRDDLFQATIGELFELAMGILYLQERRQVRLFVRKDAYHRFVSCLVYVPRENFNTSIVMRIQDVLTKAFKGLDASYDTFFSESILARIHYVIRTSPTHRVDFDDKALQKQLTEITESWEDRFREQLLHRLGEEKGIVLFSRYRNAFPAGYREIFAPEQAVFDIQYMEKLSTDNILEMNFYRSNLTDKRAISFKVFCLQQAIPLSDALPLLENLGLRVLSEQPYRITLMNGQQVWINDFNMFYYKDPDFIIENVRALFQDAFEHIWSGLAENDLFNRLVLAAGLTWREVNLLRSYTKYLRQIGFTFSEQYIASTLINNPKITRMLIELFKCYFDPMQIGNCTLDKGNEIVDQIKKALDDVNVLDEDRILRRYLSVFRATLRTNYFQVDVDGNPKNYLSFKLDPHKIPNLPLPVPYYEIFVCSPRFEGVHLRMDKVARGGIRWSDRREDYRTEILGLMKAQQVKNSVIVPAGAKGGFVTKCLPLEGSREALMEEGVRCYQDFIRGMLDLVDNLESGKAVSVPNTLCYDDADPYLVVAADKGTATFSDIANQISIERHYWMDDAFASGGSAGYDHKKMAITARGAWVSAKHHFQALGINADKAEISVVGIGDMSGDVLGNGMLMSPHLKLVAAFNHQHIFLDPHPVLKESYQERLRLFKLPRSTWEDYDKNKISQGGGIYSRALKSITISPEVKTLLGIQQDSLEPNQLIRAILKAPVDLIWNGGIGTYVKASTENNNEVGDRGNDVLRINGNELRARVVCEGGNLGLTQLARVEYELEGGRINTDFIDNSGGVDCSDHEVNIKILLNPIVRSGEMTQKQRDQLLANMSNEVADLVLQDNYLQNQVISLAAFTLPSNSELFERYLNELEQSGKIDRKLEFLPDHKTLVERRTNDKSLTRPELSILLAYTKNIYKEEIKKSNLMQDPFLKRYIEKAFPKTLWKRFASDLTKHYLATDILSTQLCNYMVSDMGMTFIYQMRDETGAAITDIIRAYVAAAEIFNMSSLLAEINTIEYEVESVVLYEMTYQVVRVIRRAVRWLLRNRRNNIDILKTIEGFAEHVVPIYRRLPKLLLGVDKEMVEQKKQDLIVKLVPVEIAERIANLLPMYHALNIVEAATQMNAEVIRVAKIYFILLDRLNLLWFRDQINAYPIQSHWSVLSRAAFKGDLDWIQRSLVIGVLSECKARSIPGKINAWIHKHDDLIKRWQNIISEMRATESRDFAILFVAIRELLDMAVRSTQKQGISSLPVLMPSDQQ